MKLKTNAMSYEIKEINANEESRFICLEFNADIFGEHFNHKEAIKNLADYIRNRHFDEIIENFENEFDGAYLNSFEALSKRQKKNFVEYYTICGIPYEADKDECIKTIHENFKY